MSSRAYKSTTARIYPYLFEGVRTGLIMATGDILAQTLVEKKNLKDISCLRAAKFGLLGLTFVGPVLKFWYGLLDRKISVNQHVFRRSVKKMLLDQSIMAPIINFYIVAAVDIINGGNVETVKYSIQHQYPIVLKQNYKLWPAAQMINFSLVPIKYQVVFVQVVAVAWNCFLSQLLNAKN